MQLAFKTMEVAAKPNVGEVTMRLLSINPRRISKARSLEAGTHAKEAQLSRDWLRKNSEDRKGHRIKYY